MRCSYVHEQEDSFVCIGRVSMICRLLAGRDMGKDVLYARC